MESNPYFKYGIFVMGQLSYSVNTYVKQKIWIEETNQGINEFSFAYMLNPHLNMNKAFKYQAKTCLSNTFGADTNRNINKTLMNRYTRVLALVFL